MNNRTKNKLIGLGFDTLLIQKISSKSQTLSGLRGQSKAALEATGYTSDEASIIISKVNRTSIDIAVIHEIIEKSGKVCCFCSDGNSSQPFQIHHIEEYHIRQNNSAANLLIVCPTHHVQIHRNKYSISYQLHVKRKWENLWKVATLYRDQGLSFPFEAVEYIDYAAAGSITEIFSFSAPRPSVCLSLSKGKFAEDASKILNGDNKLIITGDSGSGKSTMALGIAGAQKLKDVYRYVIGRNTNTQATSEIFTFLSVAKSIILIIDDANSKLHGEYIEKILAAADDNRQVIVVNTRNDLKGNNDVEEHFVKSVKYISWEEIKHSVKLSLLKDESLVVDYLKENKLDDSNYFPLGHGELNTPLSAFIETYLATSDTVWQFVYMMGGGLKKIDEIKNELYQRERLDLVFLFLSIKQISQFENGCSVDEILQFYRTNSVLNKIAAPEKEWIQEKLRGLCAKRYLKNERGRYKTIHRQLALKYIETFYRYSAIECSMVLDTVFKNYANVKEIAIMWSWLQNSDARNYLAEWCRNANFNDLVETACYESVHTLSIIAQLMHRTAPGEQNHVVNSAFKDRAKEIAELINFDKKKQLYHISQLLIVLRYHAKETIKPMCDLLDKDNLIAVVKNVDPTDYRDINTIFAEIMNVSPEWIFDVSTMLDTNDYYAVLVRVTKGDVQSIDYIMQFYGTYIFDLKRSHVKAATAAVHDVLINCSIEMINIPVMPAGLYIITMFDDDVEKILSALDTDLLGEELSSTAPRYWKRLLSVTIFSMCRHLKELEDIIEKVDIDILLANVERYYEDSQYEFRILIYLFCNGSQQKKEEFALKIKPFVENISNTPDRDGNNRNDILEAYNMLSPIEAVSVINGSGIALREDKIKKPKPFVMDDSLKMAEASGQDYILIKRKMTL